MYDICLSISYNERNYLILFYKLIDCYYTVSLILYGLWVATNTRVYRSAYVGEPVTEEFRPDRVTIVIDPKTKRIIASICG
jgi:hypothetical protein